MAEKIHRRLQQMLAKKGRSNPFAIHDVSWVLARLEPLHALDKRTGNLAADFIPIRIVTCIEVFVRDWVRRLIDHGPPYRERAIQLGTNVKFDFLLSAALQGQEISLGDIVAHDVSINSLEQVLSVIDTLIGARFRERLTEVQEPFAARKDPQAPPIIQNIDDTCRLLSRVFETRHLLTHELPNTPVYGIDELPSFLEAAREFINAANEALTRELLGDYPLTQYEMNQHAQKEAEEAAAELRSVLGAIATTSDIELSGLRASQAAWEAYCEREAELHAALAEGGSMQPMLYNTEMKSLIEERVKRLRYWLERDGGKL